MTEYSYAGLRELREALDKKKVSPSELAKYFLGRMERAATLNAFISVLGDQLLEGAAACESSSEESRESSHSSGLGASLHGIPIAIKDIILHVGSKTTAASKILSNFDSPYDATVTTKLKSAGALIAGKTNLDEFAMGSSNENSAYGVVKNPWNTAFVPGGSSGGSAAAVAAGLVPGALGTDTGGSIRQPAALCGIVGIKPTYGRVSRYGIVAFASSLDQVGVFARSSFDAAWLLETISGHCRNDSTSVSKQVPSWRSDVALGVRGLRIGIPKEYFIPGMSAEVESSVRAAIQTLTSLGATAVEISLPHTEAAVAVYYVLAPAEASSNLARYDGVRYGFRAADCTDLKELYVRSRSEGFGPEVKRRIMVGTYVLSTGYYDAYYLRAQKVRRLIAKDFQDAFETCDVIACPASPTAAFRIGEKAADPMAMYLSDVFTIPVNLAGLPGMSIPCGLTSDNLPIGLQLIGRPWDESALFRVAGAYETATDWHTRRPPQNWLQ